MQNRKILFLSSWYPNRIKPTHGNFVYQHALAASQLNQVRLLYVCLDGQMQQRKEVVHSKDPFPTTIVYLSKSRIPMFGSMLNYLRIILCYLNHVKKLKKEGFHPELVHANVVYPIGIVAWLLKCFHAIPYVFTEHWTVYHKGAQAKLNKWQKFLTIFTANRAERILPVSANLAGAMQSFGIHQEMQVVYNVIDTQLFVPGKEKNNEVINLMHVSSLDPVQKNPLLLFEAVALVLKTHPTVQLNIISDGDFQQYEADIQRLGISTSVFFHGMMEAKEIAAKLQNADLFLLTSRFENLPCVLIEARSCGVPVVSTNVGGIQEIIHPADGVLIPTEDLVALVLAINEQIGRLTAYQSDEMHQRAVELFSYEAIGSQFAQVYESILSKHGS
ncbi:MAG: glycosyltransferase [Crocinitomicaceae bacterium]